MYIFAIFQLLLFLATWVFYVISISSSRSSCLCSRWSKSHKHGGDGDLFACLHRSTLELNHVLTISYMYPFTDSLTQVMY